MTLRNNDPHALFRVMTLRHNDPHALFRVMTLRNNDPHALFGVMTLLNNGPQALFGVMTLRNNGPYALFRVMTLRSNDMPSSKLKGQSVGILFLLPVGFLCVHLERNVGMYLSKSYWRVVNASLTAVKQ